MRDILLLKLMSSNLEERTFRVKINDILSSQRTLSSGAPQGSILGPLVFLVVFNDFLHCCGYTKCYLRADDAKIVAVNIKTQLVQSDLENISV